MVSKVPLSRCSLKLPPHSLLTWPEAVRADNVSGAAWHRSRFPEIYEEEDPVRVVERKCAFVMKNFPPVDKTVEEISNEVVDEVFRRTNWRSLKAGEVSCVNLAGRHDGTLCPPGVVNVRRAEDATDHLQQGSMARTCKVWYPPQHWLGTHLVFIKTTP